MKCAITGALSYSGRYLAASLLSKGHDVVNLSRRGVPIAPQPLSAPQARALGTHRVRLDFNDVDAMARTLEGCDVLFSTYWVRFADRGGDNPHSMAAANCARLWEAAKRAGVRKVVMASHTRTSVDSPFPYIAGKAKAALQGAPERGPTTAPPRSVSEAVDRIKLDYEGPEGPYFLTGKMDAGCCQ